MQGPGIALAASELPSKDYTDSTQGTATSAVRAVNNVADIVRPGTFSPAQEVPVGYTLVSFLLKSGGTAKLGQLIKSIDRSGDLNAAFKGVYNVDSKAVF